MSNIYIIIIVLVCIFLRIWLTFFQMLTSVITGHLVSMTYISNLDIFHISNFTTLTSVTISHVQSPLTASQKQYCYVRNVKTVFLSVYLGQYLFHSRHSTSWQTRLLIKHYYAALPMWHIFRALKYKRELRRNSNSFCFL